jgi:hypothetical protein
MFKGTLCRRVADEPNQLMTFRDDFPVCELASPAAARIYEPQWDAPGRASAAGLYRWNRARHTPAPFSGARVHECLPDWPLDRAAMWLVKADSKELCELPA